MKANGAIKIEKGVPMPEHRHGGTINTLRSMAIGDSFVFPIGRRIGLYGQAQRAGIKITIRVEGKDKCRVWRTQ